MAKSTLFWLQVLALALAAHGALVDEYKLIGTYNGREYWVSYDTSQRGEIYKRCQQWLGPNAYTANIGDAEEWNFVKAQLAIHTPCTGCTRNFWTNGKYNQPTATNYGVVVTITGTTVTTRVEPNTKVYRHICERPAPAPPTTTTASPYTPSEQPEPANPNPVEVCTNPNDVIVLLDSSGSITPEDYKVGKVGVYDFYRSFADPDASRFGFTYYSSSVRVPVPFDNLLSQDEIESQILNAPHMRYQTYTNLAIDSASSELAAATPRPGVNQNIVIITDGASTDRSATIASADAARAAGYRVFVIGVGSGVDQSELLAMTGNRQDRLYQVDNFNELSSAIPPVASAVCDP